jgi:hypothetical protein
MELPEGEFPPPPAPAGLRTAAQRGRSRALVVGLAVALAFAAFNGAIAAVVAAGSRHEASAWPGSSFTFWPERNWGKLQQRIRSLPASTRLRGRDIGRVTYRNASFEVPSFSFSASGKGWRAPRVLVVSGVHGTETAGVEAVLRIAEMLARDPGRYSAVSIDLVPVINPWGWVYGYRYDGDGEDVNRDFASRRTQEARLIRGLMDSGGSYDLVLDLHESKKPGYFIYQYLRPAEGFGDAYVKLLGRLGRPRENTYREGVFAARDGVLSIPAAALPWIALGGRLSLEQYARLHGTRHAYTVETPLQDEFERRVAVDVQTVLTFIGLIGGSQ